MMLVIGVIRMSAHSLTSEVDIGSKSHDLVGEDFRILRISCYIRPFKYNNRI